MQAASTVIVRYGSHHDPIHEWVYNPADIDAANVIWAQEMGDQNQELVGILTGGECGCSNRENREWRDCRLTIKTTSSKAKAANHRLTGIAANREGERRLDTRYTHLRKSILIRP
jgi:hypothetical protein